MSAPHTDLPSSISSSGHVDGLGRRVLTFDRESGAMLERLHVRPELAAFETAIRDRITQLANFEDDRFAKTYIGEHDPITRELTVVSEFVPGSRLSDLLEASQDDAVVPGVDAALGYLLDALPALATFHTVAGVTHGLIDPARTVLAPTGQLVFLDGAFGAVIERLGLSARRLWADFGIAAPRDLGSIRFDAEADIAQTALSAVMLVLGRRLRADEYPDALPSLLMEVVDVAQIRGSTAFAGGLQRILQRSLPLTGRRPYGTADEMVVDVRQLVRREIGVDVCRNALIDFVAQMDAAFACAPDAIATVDLDADDTVTFEVLDEDENTEDAEFSQAGDLADDDEEPALEYEISLDDETSDAIHELPDSATNRSVDSFESEAESIAVSAESTAIVSETTSEPVSSTGIEPVNVEPEPADELCADQSSADAEIAPVAHSSPIEKPADVQQPELAASALEAPTTAPEDTKASSRRKRHQQRSARARKDKLRSTATPRETQPTPKPQTSRSGWLVPPERAAQFDPPVPEFAQPAAAAPAVARAPAAPSWIQPPQPVFPPTPVFAAPQPSPPVPTFPPASAPASPYGTPGSPIRPMTPAPVAAAPVVKLDAPSTPVRVKTEPPSGYNPQKNKRVDSVTDRPNVEPPIAALPYVQRGPSFEVESRPFPWKLAAAAVLTIGVGVVAGRAYLPAHKSLEDTPPAVAQPASAPTKRTPHPPPKGMGQIAIETQPAGARVLLDGKPAGETPLTIDAVTPGRHILTFVSSSGEVKRTVRVAAGRTLTLDLPIFSGWVEVFAPIVLEIAENGQTLGTTEQDRLMLPPGRHKLTLTNRELGYSSVQETDIDAGEVRSITIAPRGTANFNAVPWAEVWMEGKKIGDTPIGNTQIPLGTREFVFKNPQFGERRVIATIRAIEPAAVSVDFTKPQRP